MKNRFGKADPTRRRQLLERGLMASAMALAAVAGTTSAHAQEASGQEASASEHEIVVTARKRVENLQEVPVSIAVLDADALAEQGVENVGSLDASLPNVSIGGSLARGGNAGAYSIRGIGEVSPDANRDPTVGLYVDDIYEGRADGALLELVDIERVEVLRGPQGTLFGKNTTGGAIRVVSRRPSFDEAEGGIQVTGASHEEYGMQLRANVPLADTLAARVSIGAHSNAGWFHNTYLNYMSGDDNFVGGRVQLRWQPASWADINFSLDASASENNGGAVKLVEQGSATRVTSHDNESTEPDYLTTDYTLDDTDSTVGPERRMDYSRDSIGFGAQGDFDIADGLSARAIFGYRQSDITNHHDRDVSPARVYDYDQVQSLENYSAELQLLGEGERFNWVFGLYYFGETPRDTRNIHEYSPSTNTPPEPSDTVNDYSVDADSYAAFFQGEYALTDRLTVTAGVRYTYETKDLFTIQINALTNPDTVLNQATGSGEWEDTSPYLALRYQWTPNFMTYASWSRGFRSGGINNLFQATLPQNGITPFGPETLESTEIGARTSWFNDRLIANISSFWSEYSDIQATFNVTVGGSGRFFTNVGDGEIEGGELELRFVPIDGLSFNANVGWVDAHYTSLNAVGGSITGISLTQPFARTPELSYSLGARYEHDLANGSSVAYSINYGWKDDQRSTAQSTNSQLLPAYGLLASRLQYNSMSDWHVALFCSNCTDERYLVGGINFLGTAAFGARFLEYGDPRRIGVEVGFDF
jgi:iron complex outermembrane receptor protein